MVTFCYSPLFSPRPAVSSGNAGVNMKPSDTSDIRVNHRTHRTPVVGRYRVPGEVAIATAVARDRGSERISGGTHLGAARNRQVLNRERPRVTAAYYPRFAPPFVNHRVGSSHATGALPYGIHARVVLNYRVLTPGFVRVEQSSHPVNILII